MEIKKGVEATLARLQKEEAQKKIIEIKKNLDEINKKNLKTVKKKVKKIITYSRKEAEAVKLLIENNRLYKKTYYSRSPRGLEFLVTRLLFSTDFLKKVIMEKNLKVTDKINV